MTTQTKTWQRKILTAAAQRNELHRLYWHVEITVPYANLKAHPTLDRHMTATWPKGWAPVVPVATDPAGLWAELLLAVVKDANRGLECAIALTDIDLLQESGRWYEWGEWRWDNICERCGAVFIDTTIGVTLCPACTGPTTKDHQHGNEHEN